MATRKRTPYLVRPETAVLTRGFDPRLSVGSARPAMFRSSTYVFSSPEAAERAFDIALGKGRPGEGESVDLIYSRLSHPRPIILLELHGPKAARIAWETLINCDYQIRRIEKGYPGVRSVDELDWKSYLIALGKHEPQ